MRRLSDLPIRTRVAITIFAFSTAILVLMSLIVYFVFQRQLIESLDGSVRLRAASNLTLVDNSGPTPTLELSTDPENERLRGEAILRLYDRQGSLLLDGSPATPPADQEAKLVRDALAARMEIIRFVKSGDDDEFRTAASPILENGQITAVLVTGIERSQLNEPLTILRLIFLVAIPVTSLALAAGAFWIARRALLPVTRITQAAREISRGDLQRRITGVTTDDEIGELATTFNSMIGRLSETVERERQFTADASHELRTPLTAIETAVDVTLGQDRSPADYRATLHAIGDQASRLGRMTRQLLLLSRLDTEAARENFEAVDLSTLTEAVVEAFREQHPDTSVLFKDDTTHMPIEGDPEQLSRAIGNLLENAVIHNSEDVEIQVELSTDQTGNACVRIADNGQGVPAALGDTVFQRFRQGEPGRSQGGAGLGLAIVQAIAQLHGGSIRLANDPSIKGACFDLKIPLSSE